jgi:hypothetical protein
MPIKIKWEAEITKIRKDLHTLQKENVKLREKLRGVATEAKKGARGQEALGRAAKRVYREIETPAERYNKKIKELRRLLLAGKIGVKEYGRAAKMAHERAEDASRRAQTGTSMWLSRVTSVATGYLSVQTAIQSTMRAMEDLDEQRRRSKELSKDLGTIQRETLLMLGTVPQQERVAFVKRMEILAGELKPVGGLRTIYATMAGALSASQGDVERSVRATRQAGRVAPHSAEAMKLVAEALLDLGKATKSSDARANLGFLLGAAQQARMTSMRDIATHMAPGIIGVQARGGTAQQAGAIVSAITQAMPDPHGRMASTAAISLVQQLDKYFATKRSEIAAVAKREAQGVGALTRVEREAAERVRKAEEAGGYLRVEAPKMTPLEMIRFMRERPEARAEFATTLTTEKKAAAAVEQLLGVAGRGEAAYEFLKEALPKMVKGQEAVGLLEDMLKGIDNIFEQKLSDMVRTNEDLKDQLRAMTPAGRRRAVEGLFTRQEMLDQMDAAGVGWWRKTMAGTRYVLGQWLTDRSARDQFSQGMQEALGGAEGMRPLITGGGAPWVSGEDARLLRESMQNQEKTAEQLEVLIQATENQTDAIRQGQGMQPNGAPLVPNPWGFPIPPETFGRPKDETAETAFSTN